LKNALQSLLKRCGRMYLFDAQARNLAALSFATRF